jgi:hypothetical protein
MSTAERPRRFQRPLLAALASTIAGAAVNVLSTADPGTAAIVAGIVVAVGGAGYSVHVAIGGRNDRRFLGLALLAAAFVIVVGFALTYVLITDRDDTAFGSEDLGYVDAVYFSLATFTTTGFGDISAASDLARAVVSLQMATTFVYAGVAVGLIVPRLGGRDEFPGGGGSVPA